MPLDQAGPNGLGDYLFEPPHRHAAVARNVVSPTPRIGSFSHEFSERDDEPSHEANVGHAAVDQNHPGGVLTA